MPLIISAGKLCYALIKGIMVTGRWQSREKEGDWESHYLWQLLRTI